MLREYDEDQSGELEFREFLPFYEELTRHIKDIKHGYSTPHADGPQVNDQIIVRSELSPEP